jgi:hypothetical protein
MQYCDERPELVELCEKCKHADCIGHDGCETYKKLRKKLVGRNRTGRKAADPAITFAEMPEPPEQTGAGGTLKRCNAAIIALEALHADVESDMVVPTHKVAEMIEILRVARMEAYSKHIDWDSIAEGLKSGREAE